MASSRASTLRRHRQCRIGRRCVTSEVTQPGATKAVGRCTASNSMRSAAAPAPAVSMVTTTAAPGPAARRPTTSRASGARWAARASLSETLAIRRVIQEFPPVSNQERLHMSELPLLEPSQCVLVLVDEQAGLAFAAGSQDPQLLRSNCLAVAKTSVAFDVPVVISTSASKVYSGPLMPAFRAVLPDVVPIERRNMNLWEDDSVRGAIVATGKRTLIVAGLLTEACVSFPVLSALSAGHRVVVVADACGGLAAPRHRLCLARKSAWRCRPAPRRHTP